MHMKLFFSENIHCYTTTYNAHRKYFSENFVSEKLRDHTVTEIKGQNQTTTFVLNEGLNE